MLSLIRKLSKAFTSNHSVAPENGIKEVLIPQEKTNHFSYIISSHIQYFNELNTEVRKMFLNRVYNYSLHKKFHYIGLEQSEEIPVLISASAVQLTLGLHNYQMGHFKNIYVLADAYRMDNDEELYVGHVAPDGIYLSWKHFLYGYHQHRDNINVALHEMSHALLFNNYFARYDVDRNFRLNYEKFSTTTGPILANVITRRKSYLRTYAFTNIHEFWAVSVEAFFENPAGLKENMPELYAALCKVLNQDPLTRNKIIKSELC